MILATSERFKFHELPQPCRFPEPYTILQFSGPFPSSLLKGSFPCGGNGYTKDEVKPFSQLASQNKVSSELRDHHKSGMTGPLR